MSWWNAIKRFFGGPSPSEAAGVLAKMRAESGKEDPAWNASRNRFAVLVMGEADRQRLWQRAHRGESTSARLLSGIQRPTERERELLAALIEEHARGR